MGDRSKIGWCDATVEPVSGCTNVSAGCANCYAERLHARFQANPATPRYHHPWGEIRLHPEAMERPARWQRPRRIFVCSRSDLWHEDVPPSFIVEDVFERMWELRRHTFICLTKRPRRILETLYGGVGHWYFGSGDYLPNVWLGITIENRASLAERLPHIRDLREVWPGIIWVSLEPLLEEVDCTELAQLCDWAVIGGESGPRARPTSLRWLYRAAGPFREAGAPVFVKQLGSSAWDDELRLRMNHRDPGEWPGWFISKCGGTERLRQFPEVTLFPRWRCDRG